MTVTCEIQELGLKSNSQARKSIFLECIHRVHGPCLWDIRINNPLEDAGCSFFRHCLNKVRRKLDCIIECAFLVLKVFIVLHFVAILEVGSGVESWKVSLDLLDMELYTYSIYS